MEQIIKKETMTSLEIAEITERNHKDVMRSIRSMEDAWEKVNGRRFTLVEYKDAKGEMRPCFVLGKTECLYIATKFNDEARAKLILRWEQLETGKATPYYISNKEDETKARMAWVKGCKELLNLNESSTLMLMKKVAEPLGLPTPDYVASKGVLKSASELLKTYNTGISAQVFNKLAIKDGYIEEKQRKSSKGKTKSFKSITDKGKYYGENQTSPNNPHETQPLWYEDKFQDLLNKLLGV